MAALFQRLRRNPAALMDEDQGFGPKGAPQEQSRRPGLFRRMIRGVGDSLTGRPDREPNVLDFILRGWQGVDAMRDNQMQRDMFGMRVRQSKIEEGQADEQRRNVESAIGSLDPEMQPWARLAPEQAAQAQFRAMSPRGLEWEAGPGFTNAYRVDPETGEVVLGGRLPLRPRQGGAQDVTPEDHPDFSGWED